MNDQSICRNDRFSKWCMDGGLNKIAYIMYDKYGRPRKCQGGHVIVVL